MGGSLFLSCEIWREANNVSIILRDISKKIDEKNFDISRYSQNIESIGIIVNCHPNENIVAGWGKPRKYINYKKQYADIRLSIPYDDFINSDYDTQYLMVVENIVESLKVIGDKCRKSKRAIFDSESIINDLLHRLDISHESLKNITGVLSDEEYMRIIS